MGADNAGHAILLKAQTRKRYADNDTPDAVAALDTQASELQPAVIVSRVQDGQEEQDNEPTLEQRVQALNLHQRPAGVTLTGPTFAYQISHVCRSFRALGSSTLMLYSCLHHLTLPSCMHPMPGVMQK